MLQDEVKSVGDSLSESLVLEDLLAPLTELEHDPYAFTGQLKVSATHSPVLLVVVIFFLAHLGGILIEHQLELLQLLNLHDPLLQAIRHVVDEAVQEFLENRRLHQPLRLLFVEMRFPELLEELRAVVAVLEFREKHTLAREFNIYVEFNYGLHEEFADDF